VDRGDDRVAQPDRGVLVGVVAAHADRVGAGGEGPHGRALQAVRPAYRLHLDAVRDDQAVEAELLAEQPGEDPRAERGGQLRVVRGHHQVTGHHRLHAGGDRGAERPQLALLQLGAAAVDHRHGVVRVDAGVAVAREVLGARRHAGRLQAPDERGGVPGDQAGVGAERPYPDDRVVRVAVDVGVRGVVQRDARVGQVEAEVVGDGLGQPGVVDRAEGQVAGAGAAVPRLESGDVAGLLVDRHDHVRPLGTQAGGQRGDLGGRLDVAGEQRHAAESLAEPAQDPVRRGGADEARLEHRRGEFGQFARIRHGAPYLR
jgi:hypothetical protein